MKKMVDGYLADDCSSVVTLDDGGVEIRKTDEEGIRVPWADVAFVRSFSESTCFFTKNQIETVLAVNNDHRKEIIDYLKSSDIKVKIVL